MTYTIKNYLPPIIPPHHSFPLRRFNISANQTNDEIAALIAMASNICQTSAALVGFLENGKFRFKTSVALDKGELKKAISISKQIVLHGDFVQINDTAEEISFAAGVPLKASNGTLLGTLCVIDSIPQNLSEVQEENLKILAGFAGQLLEKMNLSKRETKLLDFLDNNSGLQWFLISPQSLKILHANKNALQSVGCPLKHILDKDITQIWETGDEKKFKQQLLGLSNSSEKYFSVFANQIGKNNTKEPVELLIGFLDEGPDAEIAIACRSLKKEYSAKFLNFFITDYDGVTKLPNRRFFERLTGEGNSIFQIPSEGWGFLTIDLENLQTIIEGLGFKVADKVVCQIVETLNHGLGEDGFLIRTTQRTFTKVLLHCNKDLIKEKARQIINLITNKHFVENGMKFKLQINVGGVLVNSEVPKKFDLLSLAQTACKIAKEIGQNQFYLVNANDNLFIERNGETASLLDVQDAIESNRFLLYGQKIQRICDTAKEYTEHYEILLRMVDKENKIVTPPTFIPQLEKHGTIVFLDKWVLKESLKLIEERFEKNKTRQANQNFIYNINLSARTISDASFLECCTELLEKYSHLTQYICFEITETAAITNLKKAQEFILTLQKLGCKFALDDYGSGSVSLVHLKLLPVDFVKIDGSYISDILENRISQIFVKAVREIADVLRIKVIAEKVENQAVEDALVELGVHYIQGYKVHRPEPFAI